MISPADRKAWSEAAGELRYLSIRLQGYVAELPDRSLPPRGRVQWSRAELGELGVLTRALELGEDDAGRAVASLDAIDTVIQRGQGESATASTTDTRGPPATHPAGEVSLLERYLAQRAIAMDSLPRLQRLGEPGHAPPKNPRPPQTASNEQSFWSGVLARLFGRPPR